MSSKNEKRKHLRILSFIRRGWRGFISRRRNIRAKINSNDTLDRLLHLYTCVVLGLNIILIVFALLSITGRSILNGVALLDSLPLAFYILPLMIILPKILLDLYRVRSGLVSMIILAISAVIFGLISNLVRGFLILVFVNILSCIFIFILGRFRPSTPLRSVGKQGIAWFVIMNILGLMMPASVVLMGQNPIATIQNDNDTEFFLEMPLADFEYDYVNISPNSQLLAQLTSSNYGVDLLISPNDTTSVLRLEEWLVELISENIPFRITLSANRTAIAKWLLESGNPQLTLFDKMADEYCIALNDVSNLTSIYEIDEAAFRVFFDMTLSEEEWASMMQYIRTVDLPSFSSYIRNETDRFNSRHLYQSFVSIDEKATELGFEYGVIIDGFTLDDLVDGDSVVARMNGISTEVMEHFSLSYEVLCSRSSFSQEMEGDVGEYLVHTYSLSKFTESMRIGTVGNSSGSASVNSAVYDSLNRIVADMLIASGNGVSEIVIFSIPSLLSSFGENAINLLKSTFLELDQTDVTYTFRIYAFRAVILAIDSFDVIML